MTDSREERAKMSAQDTVFGQAASTAAFMLSTMSKPCIPWFPGASNSLSTPS